METISDSITVIEKELIYTMHFPKQEVLIDAKQIKERIREAQKAVKLDDSSQEEIKIVFEDTEGLKMVKSALWGVTDRFLMLKRGMTVPLHRIHEIII